MPRFGNANKLPMNHQDLSFGRCLCNRFGRRFILAKTNREEEALKDEIRAAKRRLQMRTVFIALLGLILGFFIGEALAAMAGTIGFAVFSSTPSELMLWMLRSLPVVSSLACAVVTVTVYLRRRAG